MSVREFNGSSDTLVLDDGVIGQIANGAQSYLLLVKPTSLNANEGFVTLLGSNGSAGSVVAVYDNGGGAVAWGGDFGGDQLCSVGMTASAWQVIALDRTSGGGPATIRGHRKVLGSGSWTHANSAGTIGNVTTDITDIRISGFNTSPSGYKDMRIALFAAFNTQLADADYVTIEAAASTESVLSFSPLCCVEFNQAAVGTAVTDLTSNGSNETSRSGTTVIEGDDPAWTFGAGGTPWVPEQDADETIRLVSASRLS